MNLQVKLAKKIDLKSEELQLNRYRILFEKYGFPVSQIFVQAVVRDGGTIAATSRGITQNIYKIPIKRLEDKDVLAFYDKLDCEVNCAFFTGRVRMCDDWESWNGRRCNGYCDVSEVCKKLKARGR